ncbi:hypothetical protein C7E23_15345 [Elizabethkingia anophelis]|nr:hypothetical protein C7E23_15345 [Elizabethkingia anophelis]
MTNKLSLPRPFEYYKANANSNMPEIAMKMGEDFNNIWWESDEFEQSREDFKTKTETKYSPLKYEISNRILENLNFVDTEIVEKRNKIIKKKLI